MKKHLRIFTCFFLFFIAFQQSSKASHLIGGNLGYQYLGNIGGNMFRYKIILTTYTNCDNTSQIPFPEDPLEIGVYNYVSSSPNANKQLYATVTVNLVDTTLIQPGLPNNCTVGLGTCIIEGVYEGFVNVPLSFSGYYLFYERCCRNSGIVNLITDQSGSFLAFIPPTLVNNSSPTFTSLPTPFLCAGDTTTILNTAVDPDGDQLIFSFVVPYNGFADVSNPAPAPPNPTLAWPIPNVVYNSGYNASQPYGAGGFVYINGATGLTSYMAPAIGKYVVAIEIKEYRNGNLIGITRRDLQILVINCPTNPTPNLSSSAGSGQTSYVITEGQTLCFPITFYDPNGNNLALTATGQVFNNSIVNPPATISSPVSGDSLVTSNFCWTTACGQANALPYLFNVSVIDDGCPPKTTNAVYSILVNPPTSPSSITGLTSVCQNSTSTYTSTVISGSTYNWSVTGGTITSGGTGNTITVHWNTAGSGTVSVAAINGFGCQSSPYNLNVTILSAPTTDAGPDKTICISNPVQIGGSPTGPVGAVFSWSPSTGLSAANIANPIASPNVTTTYVVTVNNGSACLGTDTVVVFVGTNGSANAGNDVTICSGNTTQLNASGGVSYAWLPATGLSNPNIANPIANPAATTTYTVTITDAAGCLGTDSITVTVNSNSGVNAGSNSSICTGSSITIGGSPTGPAGSTYSWAPAATLSNSGIANPVATPISTTTYTVTVTNNGCINTGNVTITIMPLPVANAGTDNTICSGDNIQLNASGGTSYSWLPTTGLSNPNIANPVASPGVTTAYYVTVTAANTCTANDTVLVTVNPLPIADAGNDAWLCPGDNTILNASGGTVYSWVPPTYLSNPGISNPVASPADSIEYYVTVTDANGCSNIDSVDVFINKEVPTDAGPDITICKGDTIVIGGLPTSPTGTTFSWSPAGSLDNPSIANPKAFPPATTTYYVVTANDTCSGKDSITVFVNIPATADAGTDATICTGGSTQLLASGGSNYNWVPNTGLSNSAINNPIANPTSTTTYTVTIIDNNGCSNADSVLVFVNPLPTIDAGTNASVCIGNSVTLNATGGFSYTWSPVSSLSNPNIFNPVANPSTTTTYLVSGTDVNSCTNTDSVIITVNQLPIVNAGNDTMLCFGNTIQLNASGGISYLWTPSATLNNAAIANPWSNSLSTVSYSVSVTDVNGCVNTDSVLVTVNPLPAIDAGIAAPVCIGDSIQLNATGGVSYLWLPAANLSNSTSPNPFAYPIITTEYFVTGTDANSCVNIDSVIVMVNPLPVVSIDGGAGAGSDISICRGDTATLLATGGISYAWTPSTNIINSVGSSTQVYPDNTLVYYVSVRDTNGCVNNDSITVTVFRITVSPDTSICEGDSVQLFASGLNALTYNWSPASGLNNPSSQNPWASPNSTTTYTVSATDINLCNDLATVSVEIITNPTADFSVNYSPGCEGIVANFTNESINADSYIWNFGNGNSSSQFNVSHVFPYNASFITTLIAINNGACYDTMSLQNNISSFLDYFSISVPNVITPNDDGINDQFELKLSGDFSDCFSIAIFDRWGLKIFSSTRSKLEWDGRTTAGLKVVPGTYFYVLEINGIEYKGFITLLE